PKIPGKSQLAKFQKRDLTRLSLNLGPWDFLGIWKLQFGICPARAPGGTEPLRGSKSRTLAQGSSTFLRAGARTPAKHLRKRGRSPGPQRLDDNANVCTSRAMAPGFPEQMAQIAPNTPARSPGPRRLRQFPFSDERPP